MRVLITGALGFVGRHLANDLSAHGHTVLGLDQAAVAGRPEFTPFWPADIRDLEQTRIAFREAAPDAYVHLAAMAFVPACESDPPAAFAGNVTGTLNILEAVRRESPKARGVFISSAQVYAPGAPDRLIPETAEPKPGSMYGLTKLAADTLALYYAREQHLRLSVARPVNHVGPGQSAAYVMASFAAQLAAIAQGRADPVLNVGNLESTRDFLDVRDTVRGYRLLLERGTPEGVYNLAGGTRVRIRDALDILCNLAGVQPRIEVDPVLFRPTDHSPRLDTSRIRADTGWEPALTLEQTLADMYAAASAHSAD